MGKQQTKEPRLKCKERKQPLHSRRLISRLNKYPFEIQIRFYKLA